MVDDQGVGDDRIDRTVGVARLRLAHAVADHLAARTSLPRHSREVALDSTIRSVSARRTLSPVSAEHVGVVGAGNAIGHLWSSRTVAGRGLASGGSGDGASEAPHHLLIEPEHDPVAPVRDERHVRVWPGSKRTRYRRGCRGACRAPSPGRRKAPDLSRRNDSASRPAPDGRRNWRRRW